MSNGQEKGPAEKLAEMAQKLMKKALRKLIGSKVAIICLIIGVLVGVIILILVATSHISVESTAKTAKTIRDSTRFEGGRILLDDDIYEKIRDQLREDGINPDDIYLGKGYDYLERMVKASIVTSYPDTSGRQYTFEELTNMADSEIWQAMTDGVLEARPSSSWVPDADTERDLRAAVARNLDTITVPIWVWEEPGNDSNLKRTPSTLTQRVNVVIAPIYQAFFEELFSLGTETSGLVINKGHTGTGAPREPNMDSIGWATMHFYGAAIDINYATRYNGDLTNGYWAWGNRKPYSYAEWQAMNECQAKYETMYLGSTIEQLAEKYIVAWGGNWSNHDTMHFSFVGERARNKKSIPNPVIRSSDLKGVGQIYRENESGVRRKLIYVSEFGFESMIDSNSMEALNYFTVDSDVNVVVAKYNKITIIDSDGNEEIEYELYKVTLPYINKVQQYAMPFEFLYIMMITTMNPEYVGALADLAIEYTTIEFVVMDSLYIDTEEKEHSYNTTTTVIVTENGIEISNTSSTIPTTETTIEIREINSIISEITKVETWIYKKSSTYTNNYKPKVLHGETRITKAENPDYEDQEVSRTSESNVVADPLPPGSTEPPTYTTTVTVTIVTKHDIQDLVKEYLEEWTWVSTPDASDEPEISCDMFLGLWQNETGKYEEGEKPEYDPEGEVVTYQVPDTGFWKSPAESICDDTDRFFDLLARTESTQSYENLMKYILYIYTGKNYGVTDMEDLINMFVDRFSSIGYYGDALLEYIKGWENTALWNYDKDGTYTRGGHYTTDKYLTEDGLYYIPYEDDSRRT